MKRDPHCACGSQEEQPVVRPECLGLSQLTVLWTQLLAMSDQLSKLLDLDSAWLVETGWPLHDIIPEVTHTSVSLLLQYLEPPYVTFCKMHFTRESLDGDRDESTRETHYCLLPILHFLHENQRSKVLLYAEEAYSRVIGRAPECLSLQAGQYGLQFPILLPKLWCLWPQSTNAHLIFQDVEVLGTQES